MRSVRVLVVEDDFDSGEALSLLLEYEGLDVQWELSAARTLRAFEAWQRDGARLPDVILLDLMMPDMNGVEMIDELRKTIEPPPVVLYSAAPEHELRIAAEHIGAAAVVRKPSERRQLFEAIRAVAGGEQDERIA